MRVGALEHSFRAPKPSGRVRGGVPQGRECNRPVFVSYRELQSQKLVEAR